ncbi:MAG: response regulator [Lachnospiraceae bacterium]|nr:response regulator [Lachnospiraceae bacterium]
MKTIIIDDEVLAVNVLWAMSKEIEEMEIVGSFTSAREAIEFVKENPVDLALLDICMPEMDGITLGKHLKMYRSGISLVYLTGYEDYAMSAISMHAVDYILKPCSEESLRYAIESATLLNQRKKPSVYVKTFGHFDLFVDEKPILFKSGKAKELLALLVDREGGIVTSEQIISVLWEDRPNDEATQNLCSKVARTLKNELESAGLDNIFVTNRGLRYIDKTMFGCDLYEFLDGEDSAKRRFQGEYMADYSWAEERIPILSKMKKEE